MVCCAAIIGLIIGSFLNVVIVRLPVMMEQQWQETAKQVLGISSRTQTESINLFAPRSHCPHCQTPLKTWHMIPLISYLLLKGRCWHCRHAIALHYPVVELITALSAIVIVWHFNHPLTMVAILVFTGYLISLSAIDFDHQLLPDQMTLSLLWLGLIVNSNGLLVPLIDAVWGAIAGYFSLWCVYWAFKGITGREGLGFGDIKLFAALGAWLGWQSLPWIIMLASLTGAIVGSLCLLITQQGRRTPLPFGPYLAGAGWAVLIWEPTITQYYWKLIS